MRVKRIVMLLIASSMLVSMLPTFVLGGDVLAVSVSEEGYLDKIVFGNEESENAHDFKGEFTSVIAGGLGESARIAHPTVPQSHYGGNLTFTIKVDPAAQNYLTVKFWGGDESWLTAMLFVGDEQLAYYRWGDYTVLNPGYWNNAPGQFYYCTRLIPIKYTQGKDEIEITIRTADQYSKVTSNSRGYYSAYSHNNAYIDLSGEKNGENPDIQEVGAPVKPDISEAEKQRRLREFRQGQINMAKDYANSPKVNISKYNNQLKYLARSLGEEWSPHKSPSQKRAVVQQIFYNIDNHVKEYYNNTRMVARGGHQGDWGSFYRELGQALYLVENFIFDDNIIGQKTFDKFLDEEFFTGSEDGMYSLKGVDWDGGTLSRREAWERCFKASFDTARYRLSYITNQVIYTYEGAWEAHEGLRIIGSEFYEGKERSNRILGEFLGFEPFLGEEVLVGPNGEELDLYHSLFFHDAQAIFTGDQLQIVAKGLAKSKLDENGNVVRRLPYGPAYHNFTINGLGRENAYVGNYGETLNYLPEFFYMTLNHKGDEEANDEILKMALRSMSSRGYMRYTDLDNGYRVARMEQYTDARNAGPVGKVAYYGVVGGNPLSLFASLEKHMADNEERYSGEEWDEYWDYAECIVGYYQEQLQDNQFFDTMPDNKRDLRIVETYKYVTEGRAKYERFDSVKAGKIFPHTDFRYYTQEELDELEVNANDYQEFAWVDVDAGYVSLRDGDLHIFASLIMANNGYTNAGQMRVMEKDFDRFMAISTEGILRVEDYRMRQAAFRANHIPDGDVSALGSRMGIANELIPIAYQPGVGTVNRDNSELDNPYSGQADLLKARYKNYLMIQNATREEYKNATTFSVEIPADHKGDKVYDMVTKTYLPIVDGKVEIKPKTGYVLKLTSDFQTVIKPYPVTITLAHQGTNYIDVMWKQGIGAETYNLMRSTSEDGEYKVIASGLKELHYKDTDVKVGQEYFYKVCGVNQYGEGHLSWHTKITLTPSATVKSSVWRDDRIYTSKGTAAVDGSKVSITNVNGLGLMNGDESNIYERDFKDSFHFVNRLMTGDFTIAAKIDSYGGSQNGGKLYSNDSANGVPALNGLMMRENLDKNGAHIYFGADAEGNLVLRNRTRESVHPGARGTVSSPMKFDVGKYNVSEYPYIKLVRNFSTSYVGAYISQDGKEWKMVGKEVFAPMPYVSYAGLVSTKNAEFSSVAVSNSAKIDAEIIEDAEAEYEVIVNDDEYTGIEQTEGGLQ